MLLVATPGTPVQPGEPGPKPTGHANLRVARPWNLVVFFGSIVMTGAGFLTKAKVRLTAQSVLPASSYTNSPAHAK
jgi:hypothetical protein